MYVYVCVGYVLRLWLVNKKLLVFVWYCLQLEWRKGKVNPIVSSIRAKLRLMPLNVVHDTEGLPRIILTEPTGSSAEVGLVLSFMAFCLAKDIVFFLILSVDSTLF